MNRKILLLMLWSLVFFLFIMYPMNSYAQEVMTDAKVNEKPLGRNPFEPQVPKEIAEQPLKPVLHVEINPVLPPVRIVPDKFPPSMVHPIELPRPIDTRVPELKIGGVVWNTQRPQAIVNGQIVGIGDVIENARIVDIQKTGVVVSIGERIVTIEIQRGGQAVITDMPHSH